MAPPRSYHCEALTLKKFPMGEADLLVTLYTRERGKVRALARGARRSNSKLVGHFEPLTQVKVSLAQGRDLDYVTQAQVLSGFALLKENLEAITKGLYLAELVDGFGSEANPNQPLYRLVIDALHAIQADPDSDLPLRFFELHLLQASGLMPELYQCVECRKSLTPGRHRFSPNLGGTLCLDCNPTDARLRPLSLRTLKVLRLLHRTRMAELPALSIDAALARELRALLSITIQYWLDKEIRSNSFLEHVHHVAGTGV